MTTQAIIESGMKFGPYRAGQCFYIEKSDCYGGLGEGVKIAEFLLLKQQEKGPTVWIIEAKSSCPRAYSEYMNEIRMKLTNGFMLCVAACLDRHPKAKEELPDAFKSLGLKTASFQFVLVIKGVPDEHLGVLQDALRGELNPVIKTWAMSPTSVSVLNESGAKKHGLILPPAVAAHR